MSNAAKVTTSSKDDQWKKLAEQIEYERDPAKIVQLAQQLIAEFDRVHPKPADSSERLAS